MVKLNVKFIKNRLAALGINVPELHRRMVKAGETVSLLTVYRWLEDGGKRMPTIQHLFCLAAVLGVQPMELISQDTKYRTKGGRHGDSKDS